MERTKKISETKSFIISKTSKIDLKPDWLWRQKLQITSIKNERNDVTVDSTNIKIYNKEILWTTLCQ